MSNLVTALILAVAATAAALDWNLFDAAGLTWVGRTLLDILAWLAFWR